MTAWYELVSLPDSARAKLIAPVREAINMPLHLPGWHTLPIGPKIWDLYAQKITGHVENFVSECTAPPLSVGFNGIKDWLQNLLEIRSSILSLTLALAPFRNFDEFAARNMLGLIDLSLLDISRRLTSGGPFLVEEDIRDSVGWLNVELVDDRADLISLAFKIDSNELYDANNEFSPSRVFSHYYQRAGELLDVVLPHLGSLNLPATSDVLVAVSTVGWILACEDPVTAYCSMDSLKNRLLGSRGSDAARQALQYLRRSEPELRQGRIRINQTFLRLLAHLDDDEESHLALADLYKRMIEGPFRKYGWVHHCLSVGKWSEPPMLTQMRDALVAQGGWLGGLAQQAVIRDVRNGEAHETLFWDGVKEVFVVEGAEVEDDVVAHAIVLIDGFARGCEAAVSWFHGLSAEHKPIRPLMEDPGRLSSWRRAEAIFGTNGLKLIRANFNSKVARVVCASIAQENINPCLQSLVACSGLLPHVERFEVFTAESVESVVVASRESLERALPIWEKAIDMLSMMPLSTFLPVNLDSRLRSESLMNATRSVAWIAVDDFLDAFDGSAESWDAEELELFSRRIEITRLAIGSCLSAVPATARFRMQVVNNAVEEVLSLVRSKNFPASWHSVERSGLVERFRHWWVEWGPVPRLPTVVTPSSLSREDAKRPMLRAAPCDLRLHTL
ncbi:hypothetical protein [Lentzea sp. NPDC004782]|uniref:hypothetical protein n=1 Tax=Lentzea sp. NPDC004782 TaxID=3154458 RepID=UPI0033A9B97D